MKQSILLHLEESLPKIRFSVKHSNHGQRPFKQRHCKSQVSQVYQVAAPTALRKLSYFTIRSQHSRKRIRIIENVQGNIIDDP